MANNPDFYPASMDARLDWHVVFHNQLDVGGFATKYGLGPDAVDRAKAIKEWYQYWVPRRHAEDTYSQGVTKYFNTIGGKKQDAEVPTVPSQPAFGAPPVDEPPPGSEGWTRETAAFIKANPIYAVADGEAMGIVAAEAEAPNVDDMKPDFTPSTRVAYGVGVKFKKKGMSGLRFEYRHQGGSWLPGGVIIDSDGFFTVAPTTPGESEQIDVRAMYLDGNESVGQYSDIKQVFIAP